MTSQYFQRLRPWPRWTLGLMAVAIALGSNHAIAAAARRQRSTVTTLLRVAFLTSTRGVGLFQAEQYPRQGSGAPSCVLYTRPTTDGGASFGARGGTLARTDCQDGAAFSAISFDRKGQLFAYGPQIKISRDMGGTWVEPRLPGAVAGLATHGRSVWALVASCHSGRSDCGLTLLGSTDGGGAWRSLRRQPPERLVSRPVALLAEGGSSSLLAATPDGGLTLALPQTARRASRAVVESYRPSTRGWEQTTAGCIAGAFSSELASASDGSLWLACAAQPSAGAQARSVAISRDGGSWRTVLHPCQVATKCGAGMPGGGYLSSLFALSAHKAFYVGPRSALTETVDGGADWHPRSGIGGQSSGTLEVTFMGRRDGWVVAQDPFSETSTLWRTTDGGARWARA